MLDPQMELRLAEIHRLVEVGFTAQGGKLDLVLHRLDQQDRRIDGQEQRIDRQDARVDALERDYVPRTEMVREIAAVRAEASTSKGRFLQALGPVLASIAIFLTIITLVTGKG